MMRDPIDPLVAVMALLMARKNYKPKPPTAEQIAVADKRRELQRWNDEVEAKKQAKQAAKGKE